MAKVRFPGKALKLNNRKRIKYCPDDCVNQDDFRLRQIKSGVTLFREVFGDSETEDAFEGFNDVSVHPLLERKKKITINDESCRTFEKAETKSHDQSSCVRLNENILSQDVNVLSEESVILNLKDTFKYNLDNDESCVDIQKVAKGEKEINGRKRKEFILPIVSSRSSRIIKPNTKFSNDVSIFSSRTTGSEQKSIKSHIDDSSLLVNQQAKDSNIDRNSEFPNEVYSDPMCKSITMYTDCITEGFKKGQVGRPKKYIKKCESPGELEASPVKLHKEDKVKEKIEKLLKSPWNVRKRQNIKGSQMKDGNFLTSNQSKLILRKPVLNLNKRTLQKIRSQSSIQQLVSVEEISPRCALCQNSDGSTICHYGISCCEDCLNSIFSCTKNICNATECIGGKGECQLVGLQNEERCSACWLCRILNTCTMPNLLHDGLRKHLPPLLKERVPTSLSRSFSSTTIIPVEDLSVDNSFVGFGTVMDLPGGWKRKTGDEVCVISPSGEKFKSVSKLEEYLKRQGIEVEASILFGNSYSKTSSKSVKTDRNSTKSNNTSRVVVTTLPGGWSRRIKWRKVGGRYDTYVYSPDGRTFKSRKELSAYFQYIGKVDDIYKYFPIKTSILSGENSEISSTEPISSSERSDNETYISKAAKVKNLEHDSDKSISNASVSKPDKCELPEGSFHSDSDVVPSFDLTHLSEKENAVQDRLFPCSGPDVSELHSQSRKRKKKKKHAHEKDHKKLHCEESDNDKKIICKISRKNISSNDCSSDEMKRKHKRKHKHKPVLNESEISPLICDVDKISPKVIEEKENILEVDNSNDDLNPVIDETASQLSCPEVESGAAPLVEKNKPRKKMHSTESFGQGWLRKVKWNDNGIGKVSFLTSPEGQKIASSIELLAYFKKSGKKGVDLDFYFPKQLTRKTFDPVKASVDKVNCTVKDNAVVGSDSPKSHSLTRIREFIERKKKERILQNKLKMEKLSKKTILSVSKAGPRVKNVCRSQAQVLGMPRAVFPMRDATLKKKRRAYTTQKLKLLSIRPDKKILKKTLWCNDCEGCKTPECRVCVNCLDKKKFGGKNIKKKSCIRAFKSVSQTSDERHRVTKHSEPKNSISKARDGLDRKSIFIPKILKTLTDSKDKTDIETGKEFVPGTLLNIDYWQTYNAEEMLTSGFPIICSSPTDVTFCFRCGSAGVEELLYCIWCCEGIHPFCLEEGEGPDCDEDEVFWVCRRCMTCHVCGGSNNCNLLQCSGCRKHYHLECLGPSTHVSCQPSVEGIWGMDPLKMLSFSWPEPIPLVTVDCFDEIHGDAINILEDLDPLDYLDKSCDEVSDSEFEHSFLSSALERLPGLQLTSVQDLAFEISLENDLVDSIEIQESFADLESEDHICLDDIEGFDYPEKVTSDLDIVNFARNVNLYSSQSLKENKSVSSMEEDEYLCLGYKWIPAVYENAKRSSLCRLLRGNLIELFTVERYPSVFALQKKDLIPRSYFEDGEEVAEEPPLLRIKRPYNRMSLITKKRRMEVKEAYLVHKAVNEYLERKSKEKQKRKPDADETDTLFTKPESDDQLMQIIDYDDESGQDNHFWQPQSWEEFDALMAVYNNTCANPLEHSELADTEISSDRLSRIPDVSHPRKMKSCFKTPNSTKQEKRISFNTGLETHSKKVKLKKCSVVLIPLEKLDLKSHNITFTPDLSASKTPQSSEVMETQDSQSISKPVLQTGEHSSTLQTPTSTSPDDVLVECYPVDEEGDRKDDPDIVLADTKFGLSTSKLEISISDWPSQEIESSGSAVCEIQIDENSDLIEIGISRSEDSEIKSVDTSSGSTNDLNISLNSLSKESERSGRRPKRSSSGRASQLASLRKAMLD